MYLLFQILYKQVFGDQVGIYHSYGHTDNFCPGGGALWSFLVSKQMHSMCMFDLMDSVNNSKCK